MWNPLVRERATWLGIGTLIGITLAASALPDSPRIDPARTASLMPDTPQPVASRPAPAPALAPAPEPAAPPVAPVVLDRPAPVAALAASRSVPASATRQTATPDAAPPKPDAPAATRSVSTSLPSRATVAPARPSAPTAAVEPLAAELTAAVLLPVERYQTALTRLDAAATHAAWPGADLDTLVKEFTALREQRLRLERCSVAVPDLRATVTCHGTLTYRPRVGDHSTRTTRGTWRFALEHDGGQWVIDDVSAPAAAASPQ